MRFLVEIARKLLAGLAAPSNSPVNEFDLEVRLVNVTMAIVDLAELVNAR